MRMIRAHVATGGLTPLIDILIMSSRVMIKLGPKWSRPLATLYHRLTFSFISWLLTRYQISFAITLVEKKYYVSYDNNYTNVPS